MTLEIPLHITPTFVSSGQCELGWSLQFEFVVTNDSIFNKVREDIESYVIIRYPLFWSLIGASFHNFLP
jgi:hypothetical protein